MKLDKSNKIVIAGPCAFESKKQLLQSIAVLQEIGIHIIRASLWKPRTTFSWDGIGVRGLYTLFEESLSRNMIPATEIMTVDHAVAIKNVLENFKDYAQAVLWIGSRNQNHLVQCEIAQILQDTPEGVFLMYKNQPWPDEAHWLGINTHLERGGFPKNRLISCHRGFFCKNSLMRNEPDFSMAISVKEKTKIPMFLDPSHIGGSVENVFSVVKQSLQYDFDGYMIEMHPEKDFALVDKSQQLSPEELFCLVKVLQEHEAYSIV